MNCNKPFWFFLVFLEVFDLVLDWWFYYEIKVYDGAVDLSTNTTVEHVAFEGAKNVEWAILAFAIFGTLTFIIQLVVLILQIRKKTEYYTAATIIDFISTVFEDFPQIILAIIVAVNTSETISDVQYVKAGCEIFEALFHIIFSCVHLYQGKQKCSKYCKCMKRLTIAFIACGVVILLCSIFLLLELHSNWFK